ncbi:hypothetical protein BGX38DRAFT_1183186 [Terfezia claveryi]|nr:hypothetical protein BGX38DRAFT_1183186 [Terfezia claveryi]
MHLFISVLSFFAVMAFCLVISFAFGGKNWFAWVGILMGLTPTLIIVVIFCTYCLRYQSSPDDGRDVRESSGNFLLSRSSRGNDSAQLDYAARIYRKPARNCCEERGRW